MSLSDWQQEVLKLSSCLALSRRAVGVSLIETEAAFVRLDAIQPHKPMRYCQMVKSAASGHSIKAMKTNFSCQSGARVLGINPVDDKNANGENWARLGLYADAQISAKVRASLDYSQNPIFGVGLQPLEQTPAMPDVIVIVAKPYQVMRILQGYAYHYGMPQAIKMLGNQALCLECSAVPYMTQDINVSMLCTGTRHKALWGEEEMAVGIAAAKFLKVVDGIVQTVNIMEDDTNKARIEQGFAAHDLPFTARYRYNYYQDC